MKIYAITTKPRGAIMLHVAAENEDAAMAAWLGYAARVGLATPPAKAEPCRFSASGFAAGAPMHLLVHAVQDRD